MDFWQKIRRDLQKEIKASIAFLKEGAAAVKKKAREASKEGKRQYKLFELKSKVQEQMAALGGRLYDLSLKVENPMQDKRILAMISRIKKLETQILKQEEEPKKTAGKAAIKRTKKIKKSK